MELLQGSTQAPAQVSGTNAYFEALSTDILLLIFDQISQSGPESLRNVRLVSRKLNAIATPLVYRTIQITPRIARGGPLDRERNRTRRRVWANIRAHLKDAHLYATRRYRKGYNWNSVVKLLTRCRQLESITYRYRTNTAASQMFPKALKNVFETKWHRVRLNINGYLFRERDFESIPISNVVSYRKLRSASRPSVVRKFLASSTRLEALHMIEQTVIAGVTPSAEKPIKLQPLRKLKLYNCIWSANRELIDMWDFSKLEILGFRSASHTICHHFLATVQPETMPRLKHFTFLGLPYDDMQDIDRMLLNFVGGCKNLQKLTTDCYYSASNFLYAIGRIGHSLHTLKLMDGRFSRQINMSCKDLAKIVSLCPKLRSLVLESNLPESEHFVLYKTLAQFRTLHKITISTRLNSYSLGLGVNSFHPGEATAKAQEFVDFMLSECPDVNMKVKRIHILGFTDPSDKDSSMDWKLQIAMTWNSHEPHPPAHTFWAMSRKQHNKENLGLGGFHFEG